MENQKSAIGIFDSGVGGLTVLKELLKILPNEKYIYVADLKNSPYGNKTGDQIKKYTKKIVDFLISKDVKLIVVACNTASSYGIDEIKNEINIPIISVLESAVEEISDEKKILLAATKATVDSKKYDEKIFSKNKDIVLSKVACIDIVDAIENKDLTQKEIQEMVDGYVKIYKNLVDSLILGCTHYPIWEKFFKKSLGDDVKIINPAKKQSEIVKKVLKNHHKLSDKKDNNIEFYCTDKSEEFSLKLDKILKISKDKEVLKLKL